MLRRRISDITLSQSSLGLARSTRGNILALGACLAASDVHSLPGPVTTAALPAENVHFDSVGLDSTSDTVNGQVGDRNASGRGTGRAAVLVVLLDDDPVISDTGQLDVGVGDLADGAGGVVHGLDADAVSRVGHGGVGDGDVLDGVIVATADGADRETVAAGAGAAGEFDVLESISLHPRPAGHPGAYLARVDGNAVILVLDGRAADVDASTLTDVEPVGVMTAVVIAVRVVDGNVDQVEVGRLDTNGLHRGILDGQAGDSRVLEAVRVHELGLSLAAVGALAIPPAGTLGVNHGAGVLLDGDVLAAEADQGTAPFFVAEGGGAFEDDLRGLV